MIGVFDSGYGGLTVLKELLSKLPEYKYIYLGDNARAPYGNRPQKEIYRFTREAVDFLVKKGCKLIIIACNTASSGALKKIQQEYLPKKYPQLKVLGVIRPVVEIAAQKNKKKRIGVIGTKATIESGIYKQEINEVNPKIEVFQQACPLLVPLVENEEINKPKTKKIIKKYLQAFKNKKINTLILGCTHYPLLLKEIKKAVDKKILILNSPAGVAKKTKDYLKRHPEIKRKLKTNKKTENKCDYYTTGNKEKFIKNSRKFLGKNIKNVKKIKIK